MCDIDVDVAVGNDVDVVVTRQTAEQQRAGSLIVTSALFIKAPRLQLLAAKYNTNARQRQRAHGKTCLLMRQQRRANENGDNRSFSAISPVCSSSVSGRRLLGFNALEKLEPNSGQLRELLVLPVLAVANAAVGGWRRRSVGVAERGDKNVRGWIQCLLQLLMTGEV